MITGSEAILLNCVFSLSALLRDSNYGSILYWWTLLQNFRVAEHKKDQL